MNVKLDDSWKKHLNHHINSKGFKNLVDFVKSEYKDNICYPKGSLIFSALNNCKFDDVKLVILGQDPYHNPNQANGLAFSVPENTAHPPSLINIFKEIEQDLNEGADAVIIKPALSYLDIISKVKSKFNVPIIAYNVSGEYSMVKSSAKNNHINEMEVIIEIMCSMKRAGADSIITYHAIQIAEFLKK